MTPTFMEGPWKERRKELLAARARRQRDLGVLCPCPSCPHGNVSSFTGACSSCWVVVCRQCLGHDGDEHACPKETLQSLDYIRTTTRKCPGCHAPIEKATGCFQMFCTQCHTAFDWKNGTLLDKVHNPHYYDHQKETRRLCSMAGKTKFYCLVTEVGQQARLTNNALQHNDDLYKQDEERRREQCRRDMWSRFHKRGVAILLSGAKDEAIRLYVCDLKEELLDYNEHVDECLQLRGGRLFPCRASVLACT